jgi:hypothetical protein
MTWEVAFEPGELIAVAVNEPGETYQDILTTVSAPVSIGLECCEQILKADGRDLAHIVVKILDMGGNLVDTAQDLLNVFIDGPGVVLGLENGNLEDMAPYICQYRRAHNGKLLIYVGTKLETGTIKVRVEANRLRMGEITIECQ